MNGKTTNNFDELYENQVKFQKDVLKNLCCIQRTNEECREIICGNCNYCQLIPRDSSYWFQYHCLALTEEIGEVIKTDKRWKTHRNAKFDREEKLDELADVFIETLNIGIYSGFTPEEIYQAISQKINENKKRLEQENI